MEWFLNYYNGWVEGGFFYWLYPLNGYPAPIEPWHTAGGFWVIHGSLVFLLIAAIIFKAIPRLLEGQTNG